MSQMHKAWLHSGLSTLPSSEQFLPVVSAGCWVALRTRWSSAWSSPWDGYPCGCSIGRLSWRRSTSWEGCCSPPDLLLLQTPTQNYPNSGGKWSITVGLHWMQMWIPQLDIFDFGSADVFMQSDFCMKGQLLYCMFSQGNITTNLF